MNVLLFSDLHESSRGLWALSDFLSKNKDISGLVFAGDLVNMGEPVSFAEKFVEEISKFKLPLLWVPGNNDFGESYKVLQNFTPSLEGRIVELGNRSFTGIGGSPASWASEYAGENSLSSDQIAGTILVTHQPPDGVRYAPSYKKQDTSDKQIPNLEYPNSNGAMKQLNNEVRLADAPIAHICGHVHNTQGIGYIGETKVIKLASSALGNIAIMNLDNLEVNFLRLL